MATEFKSRDELKHWLDGRSFAEARVIANRAALRIVPIVSVASDSHYGARGVAASASALFRASALAWAAAKYPEQVNELSSAAARAVHEDAIWAAALPVDIDPAVLADIGNAALAVAAAFSAAFFADAATSCANAVSYAASGDLKLHIWESVNWDALALAEGLAPDLVANRPLWPRGMPHPIEANFDKLVRSLPPNEDWFIWAAWYHRRLMGLADPESAELVFARVPDHEWKKGPAAANAWIKAELANLEPKAIPNVTSVFTFKWNEANRIALSSGPQNLPVFPFPGNEADHRSRLDAERMLVERLISDIAQKRNNIRADYLESLQRYASDLPNAIGASNFLLADAEARTLRALFESEADCLPPGFATRLRIVLEQHIALRVFYPEVERLYLDVRKGRLEEPLPQDAVEKAARTIAENTPTFFEPEVTAGLKEVEREPPHISLSKEDLAAHAPGIILPPPDPIGTLDPKKSRDFMTAAAFNKLLEAAEKGDKVANGIAGWGKAFHQLSNNVAPIIDWLSKHMGN